MIKTIGTIYLVMLLGAVGIDWLKKPFHKKEVQSLVKAKYYPKDILKGDK